MRKPRHIHQYGTYALLLEWEPIIDIDISHGVHTYAEILRTHPGVTECIPAYASLLITYRGDRQYGERLRDAIYGLRPTPRPSSAGYLHELPVCYGDSYGPDLRWVSEYTGLTAGEIARIHASTVYTLYFLGYRPGFGFMGQVDKRLRVPRLSTPRTRVPAGSVGLAGKQTGIYPDDAPGGWQLIGRCPLPLIGSSTADLTRMRAGDRVRFRAIPPEDYEWLLHNPDPWPVR